MSNEDLRRLAEAAKIEGYYSYACAILSLLDDRDRLAAENARLRAALQRIAESNVSWTLGQIAAAALERKEG